MNIDTGIELSAAQLDGHMVNFGIQRTRLTLDRLGMARRDEDRMRALLAVMESAVTSGRRLDTDRVAAMLGQFRTSLARVDAAVADLEAAMKDYSAHFAERVVKPVRGM
jgi:hypothetical protein